MLVSVTKVGALDVLTVCGLKGMLDWEVWIYTSSAPVPDSAAVVGLSLALELTVSVPVRTPDSSGWKFTVTAQLPPAGMVTAQESVAEKMADGEVRTDEIVTGVA